MSSQRQFEADNNQQSVSQNNLIKNEQKKISNNNEQEQSRMEKKQQNHLDKKKKIIKKWQFGVNKQKFINSKGIIQMQGNNNKGMENKDDLRNWKPVNLRLGKKPVDDDDNKQNMHVKKQNIARSFLSMLPKPKQNNNDEMDSQNWRQKQMGLGQKRKKKPIIRLEQQEQEADQKWDGDNDEFMKQQPLRFQQEMQNPKQSLNKEEEANNDYNQNIRDVKQGKFKQQQDDEQDEVIERINWLDGEIRQNKKQLSIAELVNRTWEKQQQQSNMRQNKTKSTK